MTKAKASGLMIPALALLILLPLGRRGEGQVDTSSNMSLGQMKFFQRVVTVDSLLSWWDSYRDECWKDSTEESGWRFHTDDQRKGRGWVAGWDEWETWWVHRDPTLQGFMDFLRRRQGLEVGEVNQRRTK